MGSDATILGVMVEQCFGKGNGGHSCRPLAPVWKKGALRPVIRKELPLANRASPQSRDGARAYGKIVLVP